MSDRWPLRLYLDVPEPRPDGERYLVPADGLTFDLSASPNVYIDPITRTAMLAPLPTLADWATTTSGDYARLQKSAYTLSVSGDWVQTEINRVGGNYFLEGNSGAQATTTASYNANQPMYLAAFIPGTGDMAKVVVLQAGWGTGPDNGVWFKLYNDGSVIVYKGSSAVGVYELEGGIPTLPGVKSAPQSVAQKFISLLLLPCRRRSLLVVTNYGTGFEHIFTDLDPFNLSNSITPAAAFWWQCPNTRAIVQLAPVKFLSSGTLYGRLTILRSAPPTGTVFNDLAGEDGIGPSTAVYSTTYSLVDSAGGAFVPNGVLDQARVKVSLSGNTLGTMGVYTADLYSTPGATATSDEPFDLTTRLLSLSLSVPEEGPAEIAFSARDPERLEDLGLEQADVTGDRPCAVRVGEVDIFRGTVGKPVRDYGRGYADGIGDVLTWEGADREREFADHVFDGPALPYDGIALTDAFGDLLALMGYGAGDLDISSDSFDLPYSPAISRGEWQLLPEFGDTCGQWLDELLRKYAGTWARGWMPTLSGYKYRLRDPATFSAGPHLELYQSIEDAKAAGVDPQLLTYRIVENLSIERISPEYNRVVVRGRDPGTNLPIWSQHDDTASQTPETAAASRPANWRGKRLSKPLDRPEATTQAAADRIRDIARYRLTEERVIARWDSDLLVRSVDDRPLWKSDVVRLWNPFVAGVANGYVDYRIVAIPRIEMRFEPQGAGALQSRACEYQGERL